MTKLVIASLLLIALAGCGSWGQTIDKLNPIDSIKPYQIEVQQGNLVTQEMLAKLKPGMTPSQVRFVLGTPMIVDPFHKDRWDYAYLLQKGSAMTQQRRITILFENDKLIGIEGDVVPAAEPGPAAQPAAAVKPEEPAKP
ncbi:MAG: outer membrane protein assembly factor BamE [Gallionellaceae bacterium]|nr:outer membrane protein assembly factor BamE [Gallionellaceae bacterium]